MFFVPPPILISFDVLLLFKVGGKSREDVLLSDSVGPAVCTQAFLYLCTDCDGRAAPLQSRPVALITHFIFPSSSLLSAGRDSHSLRWFHRAACRRYAQNSVCVGGLFILSTNWTTLRSCRGVLHSSGPQGWFLDVAEDKNESFPLTEMNFSQNSIETNQCFFYWSSADAVCFICIDVAELERPCQWSEVHFKGSRLFRSSSRPAGGDEMRRRQAGRSVDDALSHHEQGNTTDVSTKTQLKGGGNDRTGKRLISEERHAAWVQISTLGCCGSSPRRLQSDSYVPWRVHCHHVNSECSSLQTDTSRWWTALKTTMIKHSFLFYDVVWYYFCVTALHIHNNFFTVTSTLQLTVAN